MVNVDKPRWCEMTKTTIKPRWCGCEDERNKTYEEKKENYRKEFWQTLMVWVSGMRSGGRPQDHHFLILFFINFFPFFLSFFIISWFYLFINFFQFFLQLQFLFPFFKFDFVSSTFLSAGAPKIATFICLDIFWSKYVFLVPFQQRSSHMNCRSFDTFSRLRLGILLCVILESFILNCLELN